MERRDPRDLIGVPFRLHGRDPTTGLDCVGVLAWTFGDRLVPTGYVLRQGSPDAIIDGFARAGLVPVVQVSPGDALLFQAGPAQFHLGIKTDSGVVHACALLRRVVEAPGFPHWPLIGAWRQED